MNLVSNMNAYLRYVSEPLDKGVLITHFNEDNVTEYIEPIRSARVVLNWLAGTPAKRLVDSSTDLVITVTNKIENVEQVFNFLSRYPYANVRTSYVIVYLGQEQTDKIFESAWRAFIINIAVLRQDDASVYTYFPYGHGECGERIRTEVLGQCQQLSWAALYPAKVPNVFHGCSFRICTQAAIPAVIDPRANTGDPLIDGYENIMVNRIVERLNLAMRLNASITISNCGLGHNLTLNISDMCFGVFMLGRVTESLYVASYVYHMDPMVWYAPLTGPGAQWMSVILVFQGSMWYAVLGFFLLNTFVWWIFGRETNCRHASYLECLLGSLLVLLNGSVPFPKRTVMRFLVTSRTVCFLLVIAAYQCQFLGILLKPVYEKQITNERKIVESGVPIFFGPRQENRLKQINDQYSATIIRRSQDLKVYEYSKYIIVGKKHAVFMLPLINARYNGMYSSKDSKGRPTVYAFKEPIYIVLFCMYFRYGHPMLDRWNEPLMQFVESGILGELIRDVDRTPPDILEEPEMVAINLHHLSSAFYILLFGYAAALLAFLFEQVVHQFLMKTKMRLRRQR